MGFRAPISVFRSLQRERRARCLLFLIAFAGLVAGCEGAAQAPTAIPATVSGHVYQRPSAQYGEPMLSDVLITIETADGSQRTTRTDGTGFYSVCAARGVVSISATKEGYQVNRSQFELANDTVLNFSLAPDLP
jgi:hypothetical protein